MARMDISTLLRRSRLPSKEQGLAAFMLRKAVRDLLRHRHDAIYGKKRESLGAEDQAEQSDHESAIEFFWGKSSAPMFCEMCGVKVEEIRAYLQPLIQCTGCKKKLRRFMGEETKRREAIARWEL